MDELRPLRPQVLPVLVRRFQGYLDRSRTVVRVENPSQSLRRDVNKPLSQRNRRHVAQAEHCGMRNFA